MQEYRQRIPDVGYYTVTTPKAAGNYAFNSNPTTPRKQKPGMKATLSKSTNDLSLLGNNAPRRRDDYR